MIRNFTPRDVNKAVDLAMSYATEAGSGIGQIDKTKLIEYIRHLNISNGYKIFVGERQQEMVAFAVCCAYDNPWNGIREGNIIFFYIMPEYRKGFLAKDLIETCEKWFREHDCMFYNANIRSCQENYDCNEDFLTNGDEFFSKVMHKIGYHYVKEIV